MPGVPGRRRRAAQQARFLALPMGCVDGLGDSRVKPLLLGAFLLSDGKFSGDDVGGTWHRVTMPFEFAVRRESDFQYRQLRLAQRIRIVGFPSQDELARSSVWDCTAG